MLSHLYHINIASYLYPFVPGRSTKVPVSLAGFASYHPGSAYAHVAPCGNRSNRRVPEYHSFINMVYQGLLSLENDVCMRQ